MQPTFSPAEQQLIDECDRLAHERFDGELEISLESDDALTWDALLIASPSEKILIECPGGGRQDALTQLRDRLRQLPPIKRN
jgi:hypothetical protein